jgi:hypothetical protein
MRYESLDRLRVLRAPNDSDQRLAPPRLATPQDSIASPLHRLVYARHGRDCMGCESPVRDWEPEGDQQTK